MKFSVVAFAVLVVLVLAPPSMGAIVCKDVLSDFSPCLNYLVGGIAKPPDACCNGFAKLASEASTVEDRRAACTCLISAAQSIKADASAIQALPGSCGITLPYKASLTIDCSKLS